MKREILFRGKHIFTGEWYVGSLLVWPTGDCMIKQFGEFPFENKNAEVRPDTVSQFTGLTDKNGKRIFEGDLLDQSILGSDHTLEKIVIRNGCVGYEPVFPDRVHPSDSMWKSFWRQGEQEMWPVEYFTIVGNIYDNPELLEEHHEV